MTRRRMVATIVAGVLVLTAASSGAAVGASGAPGARGAPGASKPPAAQPSLGCLWDLRPPEGTHDVTVTTPDGERTLRLTFPGGVPRRTPMPVVFDFHPFLLPAAVHDLISGMSTRAAERGYVVVQPQGAGFPLRWTVPGGFPGVDDDAFVTRILDALEVFSCIDRARVYAAGYSAGGAMAVALGCRHPDRFAAVAAVAGANITSLCPDRPGVSTLVVHGTDDFWVPITGVPFIPPVGISVDAAVASFATRAGCTGRVAEAVAAHVERIRATGCATGEVEYYRVLGGGHTWPGTDVGLPFVGETNTEIDATELILESFSNAWVT